MVSCDDDSALWLIFLNGSYFASEPIKVEEVLLVVLVDRPVGDFAEVADLGFNDGSSFGQDMRMQSTAQESDLFANVHSLPVQDGESRL